MAKWLWQREGGEKGLSSRPRAPRGAAAAREGGDAAQGATGAPPGKRLECQCSRQEGSALEPERFCSILNTDYRTETFSIIKRNSEL